ncbi:hypothetical protein LTR37_019332 [Vermiconidia calcicola]|uniref:Uncharacterized protein n=1 Tax=Vermiconidia calcicola TaxID=1690605 RepID=A0ACC3MEK9_9PEZI|nr:hypothetical protein LTR37_019332 [Vermiconidia calcicola]
MLFSPFTSPRKLALFAVLTFILAIIFLQSSPYRSDRIPHAHIPSFSSDRGKSSPEQDQGRIERPSEGGLQRPGSDDEKPSETGYDEPDRIEHEESKPKDWLRPTDDAMGMIGLSKSKPVDEGRPASASMHSPSPGTPKKSSSTRTTVKHKFATISHMPHKTVHSKVQDLLAQWTPPAFPNHWPPYEWYGTERDYDPNRWEGFDWENDFYINNGIRKLKEEKSAAATPVPYLPYPDYNSAAWKQKWQGEYVPCEGARGKLLNESTEDWMKAYPAMLDNFPNVTIGDANATGIDLDHCFDRFQRFGPYGYGQEEEKEGEDWEQPEVKMDWEAVNWGQLQNQCLISNNGRYNPNARQPINRQPGKDLPKGASESTQQEQLQSLGKSSYHPRTALLIRTWEGYEYTDNDIEAIRALITELSLMTGGEYQVFLFVNVKDLRADIYQNEQFYQDLLKQHVPPELQGISILWNENIFEEWYPKVGDWQVYWHQFMPLQWFSKMYPEFDFVWNWETDARYTGNHYHFLEKVAEFAKRQPRKYLWERNARFYFPSAHGSYTQWLSDTHATIHTATQNKKMDPVWGPRPYNSTWQHPIGPAPPHALETDDFEWGVNEEADLITLQPIWEPTHAEWTFRDKIWNYLPGIRPHFTAKSPLDEGFTHPEFKNIPRRTYINTLSRFSRRQLHAMHLENVAGRSMQAEMWPASVALQHGLKAVYAPHPIWADRRWPAWYLDAIFNADGGEEARWGARGDSVYNHDREHNFAGWSWYYASEFPRVLYRRWLGWPASAGSEQQYPNNPLLNLGGEGYEEEGVRVQFEGRTPDGSQAAPAGGSFGGREVVVGGRGRMCLPPMLLHPVKKVYREAEDERLRGRRGS